MLKSTMPKSVILYERIGYSLVILTVASMPLHWSTINKYMDKYPATYPLAIFFGYAAQIAWIWLIARKRKNWARWISVVLIVVGIPQAIQAIENEIPQFSRSASIVYFSIYAGWVVATSLLFRRDAREWFGPQPKGADRQAAAP